MLLTFFSIPQYACIQLHVCSYTFAQYAFVSYNTIFSHECKHSDPFLTIDIADTFRIYVELVSRIEPDVLYRIDAESFSSITIRGNQHNFSKPGHHFIVLDPKTGIVSHNSFKLISLIKARFNGPKSLQITNTCTLYYYKLLNKKCRASSNMKRRLFCNMKRQKPEKFVAFCDTLARCHIL